MPSLFPKPHRYIQRSPGTWVKGTWTEGTETVVEFTGDIQAMDQKKAVVLSIGRDNLGKVIVITDTVFNIADETTKQNGDLVTYHNENYEIIGFENWDHGLLPHNFYIGELRKNV